MNTLSEKSNQDFSGHRVVSFESRMADVMDQSLRKHGANALVAPSMQELPLDNNPEAMAFGEKLMTGEIDLFIAMTGVGTRYLIKALEEKYSLDEIVQAFSKTTVVVRGPKPVQVLREYKIPIAVFVPEPNTWREIMEELDYSKEGLELENKTIAIQEYGIPNHELVKELKKRKACVIQVPIYRWALPSDREPLERAMDEILSGGVDIVMFTSAQQLRHVLQVAREKGKEKELLEALRKVVVSSIGPTATEAIQGVGLSVDFEPSHPKMGHMIAELSKQSSQLVSQKENADRPGIELLSKEVTKEDKEILRESVFLKACRGEQTPYTPIWLMRQAGRYMKEYRDLRNKVTFMELCRNKDLAAEVTIHAAEKLKVDAAIIFSDILLIVEPMGLGLEYAVSEGPVISGCLESKKDVEALRDVDPQESFGFLYDAIKLTRSSLNLQTPLIGFSGAPFTLASYMIEGGGSKLFAKTKTMMYQNPEVWHLLMDKISNSLIKYLQGQINAGADAIQIFDSWVGCLGPADYRQYVLPYSKKVIEGIQGQVPVIHFGTGTGTFIKDIHAAGGDVIGLDYRVQLDVSWKELGHDVPVQGNMDPLLLYASPEVIRKRAQEILDQAAGRPGHVFNLGHGILPKTPVENVIDLVEYVHEYSKRS